MISPGATRLRRRRNITVGFVLLTAVAAGSWWLVLGRGLDRVIQQGLQLVRATHDARGLEAALDKWEKETASQWQSDPDSLARRLFDKYPLEDAGVQRLLARVTGAEFRDRTDEWKHFRETWRMLHGAAPPRSAATPKVKLEPRWKAPIGLTAWFSTILPLDGQIYVASLGSAFDDPRDENDGVVRVDGATGNATLIFTPPDRGPRDVLGLAAGNDTLFVACRNGFVYAVDRDGKERWKISSGALLTAPPLALDINRDKTSDVIVVNQKGAVVAISGANGRTVWTAPPPKRTGRTPELADQEATVCTKLAAGNVLGAGSPDIVVTNADGSLRILAANNGAVRWETNASVGFLAGAIIGRAPSGATAPALTASHEGTVWSLLRAGRNVNAAPSWPPPIGWNMTIVAGLRTIQRPAPWPAALIACSAGQYRGNNGAVAALANDGVQWRFPTRGIIWSTPAIADLNGDGVAEIVVPTIERAADGSESGVLLILSRDGQLLRQMKLDAPVECGPVIADVDGDGKLELLLADRTGWLHCLSTGGFGPVEWGLPGGDSHNTNNTVNAYSFGQTSVKFQWKWKPGF